MTRLRPATAELGINKGKLGGNFLKWKDKKRLDTFSTININMNVSNRCIDNNNFQLTWFHIAMNYFTFVV